MENRIPDLYMEQQLLGELSPEKESEIMNNPETHEKLKKLRASDEDILKKYPAGMMAGILQKKLEEEIENEKQETQKEGLIHDFRDHVKPTKVKIRKIIPLLAAAALAVTIILPLTMNRGNSPLPSSMEEQGIRIKGLDSSLNIYRKNGGDVELLPNEERVKSFDLLQLSYISGGKKYGAIFSIDGNGFVTLHYPDFTGASPELSGSGEVPLDFSYQLDDAPGFERFFFVTSDSYFSVSMVLESAARLADSYSMARDGILPVPDVCDTKSILLIKEGSNE
ncbi:MAG: hypothetical protein JEY99_17175 [Spirochaetales bacterium]|nr:hypothetical protein [Spirochaetales bacterium]